MELDNFVMFTYGRSANHRCFSFPIALRMFSIPILYKFNEHRRVIFDTTSKTKSLKLLISNFSGLNIERDLNFFALQAVFIVANDNSPSNIAEE